LKIKEILKKIRHSKIFEIFIALIIIFSSIMLGANTYNLSAQTIQIIYFLDYSITVFFIMELAIKMLAEDKWINFFKHGWNIFDFLIVFISLMPLENSDYVMVARLLRLFRVLRLISFIPELRTLITALFIALPRIGYVALLMFIIFYIYAIIGNLLFQDINNVLWGDLGISLLTLFRVATFEDWTDVMYETMEVYPLSWIFYISFIFLASFIFLNMMIGVVLDVLSEEAHHYKQAKLDQEQKEILDTKIQTDRYNNIYSKILDLENTLEKLNNKRL
jgi:voltage-gated sodium channel